MYKTVHVELGERGYDIHIGENRLAQLSELLRNIPKNSKVILVTDQNVFNLAGEKVLGILQDAGFQVVPAVIPGGEGCKNLNTIAWLYDQMINYGLDRKSTVLALGGGIVGDIAGFAASTYMRGIGYIQIPTTLLAQVDSSVGGKTGVNLPQGKNLVGAFYQPGLVLADVAFINSLPEKEYLTGLAEVIKYGIIGDSELFSYLEDNLEQIKARESKCLIDIVERCCTIKAEIVGKDEKESGLRALLNLGHTFGHAFEALTGYEKFTHGEAVAVGMIYAAGLASGLGLLSDHEFNRIINLIKSFNLPASYGELSTQAIIGQMYRDKKSVGGKLQLILPTGIGKSKIVSNVTDEQIKNVLNIRYSD
ncbi:3-dehydroquinate synthase [Desulfolucanica intricata]|uniref:3-dehydroquinate synthase n=1 Tax=Desulfolucanica intricata TaxID=1285191 RepID=UPI00082D6EAD|nr:3-dehydroquinate synthase [Desulfolucanica intricata]